ncbi:signal peptide, CUB and EGF-like domain-containing protein 2 [Montipora capricornis]|uniref:signal peptide, CUB and EGF-like domain-containing protein 2 n=1 Tax=Montipora capricornis TaxID=246305 RepID=UPI0035F14B80
MDLEDADECKNSSTPVCHTNAKCQNTIGSFVCSCEPGFSGNAKTCWDINECISSPCDPNATCQNNEGSYVCSCNSGYAGDGTRCEGWTLAARFSNADAKNWMQDNGLWWYDLTSALGDTTDPSHNTDMISEAFWLVNGTEFKITRSDDPLHTPLLQTTGNCLGGQTFRSKITSFGDFRSILWGSEECRGRCTVQYGGQYQSTQGFGQATCDGPLQNATNVGFWCDWSNGDGAVMMIGGGGSSCSRADHGIGITESDDPAFASGSIYIYEYDFGNNAYYSYPLTSGYSLNLWIDSDECITSSQVCDPHATCRITDVSHVCSCKPGFLGDGKTCIDIDECISSPCDANATCQNNLGSYFCSCNPGYAANGTRCEDFVPQVEMELSKSVICSLSGDKPFRLAPGTSPAFHLPSHAPCGPTVTQYPH